MTAPRPSPNPGAAVRIRPCGTADQLVREEPLLLRIHDSQLLTMRTPGQDEDLALGFLVGEGIVQGPGGVAGTEFVPGDPARLQADELRVRLVKPPDAAVRGRLARTHEIRTSCGVCGVSDPQQLLEDMVPLLPGTPRVSRAQVHAMAALLQERQELFAATGACHGALVASPDGTVHGFGEDVGRHNALDKAIGAALRTGTDLTRAVVLLSGRTGYDLVVKCLRARIGVIASVSAPSALAFDLCHAAGATLLGFVRGNRLQVYCDAARLTD
ncbi:MAG: hypothetical protein RL148_2257 [Planctomycetota bacterium]